MSTNDVVAVNKGRTTDVFLISLSGDVTRAEKVLKRYNFSVPFFVYLINNYTLNTTQLNSLQYDSISYYKIQ